MTDYSVIWTPLVDAFRSIDASLTFLILFGLIMAFSIQIISWISPPKRKWLGPVAIGGVIGAINVWAIYTYLPLGPSLINASIVGVYDGPGYLWVGSLLALVLVFCMNAVTSWNKPQMELIQ